MRGKHGTFVFTRNGHAVKGINNSGWKAARRRAAKRYAETIGAPCPQGFRFIRVHDLKHTFGRRPRASGVSFGDRQDSLGHKSARITTHYSAAEISNLIEAANKVCQTASRKSPAIVLLRAAPRAQPLEKVGGKGGINTRDASRWFLKKIFKPREFSYQQKYQRDHEGPDSHKRRANARNPRLDAPRWWSRQQRPSTFDHRTAEPPHLPMNQSARRAGAAAVGRRQCLFPITG